MGLGNEPETGWLLCML